MNEILDTIKDLGFPIAGCIVLAMYINKIGGKFYFTADEGISDLGSPSAFCTCSMI